MEKVILATSNQGKVKEFADLLLPLNIQIISVNELDQELVPHVLEDGQTFEENALKKANAFYERFNLPTLADDSGLEVDALGGEPGVYSARYAGQSKGDQANNEKLLEALKGVPQEQRTAHFTCVIAFVDGKNPPLLAKGKCDGSIAGELVGTGGFGYDPLFFVPELGKTMAELTKGEKNKISHRFHALQDLLDQVKRRRVD